MKGGRRIMDKESTIENLFDSKDFVIIDSCAFGCNELLSRLYDVKKSEELNERDLNEEIEQLNIFLRVFGCKSSVTIPAITSELRTYCELLGNKVSYLRNGFHHKNPLKNEEIKRHSQKGNHRNNCNSRLDLLKRVQKLSFEIYRESKKKEFSVSSPKFDYLVDMIKIIDKAIGLKRNTSHLYGFHDSSDDSENDTDERVVATLLWRSMFSADSVAVLTRDTDFPRLLGVALKLMASDDFLPYNEYMRGRITQNPLNLLMIDTVTRQIAHTCYDDYIYSDFKIYGSNPKENHKSQKRILELWKRFSKRD